MPNGIEGVPSQYPSAEQFDNEYKKQDESMKVFREAYEKGLPDLIKKLNEEHGTKYDGSIKLLSNEFGLLHKIDEDRLDKKAKGKVVDLTPAKYISQVNNALQIFNLFDSGSFEEGQKKLAEITRMRRDDEIKETKYHMDMIDKLTSGGNGSDELQEDRGMLQRRLDRLEKATNPEQLKKAA